MKPSSASPPVSSPTDTSNAFVRASYAEALSKFSVVLAELLLHLRDDLPGIAWPDHWSVLGGGCDPGEHPAAAIVRELDEEAGLAVDDLIELFEIRDEHGSGQLITFFAASWDGDETALPLAEGVKLQFLAPEGLEFRTIPPFIRDGINRYLATRHA